MVLPRHSSLSSGGDLHHKTAHIACATSITTDSSISLSFNEQGVLTDVTPLEQSKKAKLHSESTHYPHNRTRGSFTYGSESETLDTLDEQKRAFENFEMDELRRPIFIWPLGPAEILYSGAPDDTAQESSRNTIPQNLNSEVPESQRHRKYPSREAPMSARASKRLLYEILDECHNHLQDESNVPNTAELLKKKADLGPVEKIDVALFQQKETIFVLATKSLKAFTPRGHSSVVADKYRGAVDSILVIAVGY